jgi:aldehyde dehydrogenase (NAD+)
MNQATIPELVKMQRTFFGRGETKDIAFRIRQLKELRKAIIENEGNILDALRTDLKGPVFEAYSAELAFPLHEIGFAIKNLKSWASPSKVPTPLMHWPASSRIHPEPLGVVLIISPWNVPFKLLIDPLVGAMAAGNCAILKPSEVASHTSSTAAKMIRDHFDSSFVAVVEGAAEQTQALLAQRFDHIFFTGGTAVGKIVMEAAAKHLTPVTLELGGKTPCIVDKDIRVDTTARRIVWGKFLVTGQNCVAPDYLLVHKDVKAQLLPCMVDCIKEFYGEDPSRSPDYGRIIDDRHFLRLSQLLEEGKIVVGGQTNSEDRYIAPTIIDDVSLDHKTMREEIFGPILPVLEYADLEDAIAIVNDRPKPLALYYFSRNKEGQRRVLR